MLIQGRGVRWHLPFRPVGLALIFCLRGGGGISRHAFPLIGATARLIRRGAAYHRPAALQAAISHSGDGPRPLPYRALEPRGGIEPPRPRRRSHGCGLAFCYSTRHIKHHHKMMLCPAYTGHLWSHREESNLQPTDYKTVALPVELRWLIYSGILSQAHEVPLRYASAPRSLSACLCCSPQRRSYYRSVFRPASTDGSDPAVRWESWHRHRFRLHDRRASCPFSGAVRRSRLPGIVSFHSQPRVL